jgi:hypothetical protein
MSGEGFFNHSRNAPTKSGWCDQVFRYQRVISLEKQVGITSQRNKWANTDPWTYWKWDQLPMRSKHPLSTSYIHRELSSMVMNT